MVDWWSKMFNADGGNENSALLPTTRDDIPLVSMPYSTDRTFVTEMFLMVLHIKDISPEEVTKCALRLKQQIESVISLEIEEERVTKALSPVITPAVIKTSREAGGACVVYALLVCRRWFHRQSLLELWAADLYRVRAVAAEIIAKRIIESEEDDQYLFERILLKRYAILVNGQPTAARNALESSVEVHALHVIGSSGYQKAISYLWRGWYIQDVNDFSASSHTRDKTTQAFGYTAVPIGCVCRDGRCVF